MKMRPSASGHQIRVQPAKRQRGYQQEREKAMLQRTVASATLGKKHSLFGVDSRHCAFPGRRKSRKKGAILQIVLGCIHNCSARTSSCVLKAFIPLKTSGF